MGRKSKADVRKKEILEHFYIVLKQEGFENASIAKIANLMDVNPSLLIHYFKTKEEMVFAFVECWCLFVFSKTCESSSRTGVSRYILFCVKEIGNHIS